MYKVVQMYKLEQIHAYTCVIHTYVYCKKPHQRSTSIHDQLHYTNVDETIHT